MIIMLEDLLKKKSPADMRQLKKLLNSASGYNSIWLTRGCENFPTLNIATHDDLAVINYIPTRHSAGFIYKARNPRQPSNGVDFLPERGQAKWVSPCECIIEPTEAYEIACSFVLAPDNMLLESPGQWIEL